MKWTENFKPRQTLDSCVSGRTLPGREEGKISFVLLLDNTTLIQFYFRGVEIKDQVIFYSLVVPFILKRGMFLVTLTIWTTYLKLKQNLPYPSAKNEGGGYWFYSVTCFKSLGYIWKIGFRMSAFTLYLHTDPDHSLTEVSKYSYFNQSSLFTYSLPVKDKNWF